MRKIVFDFKNVDKSEVINKSKEETKVEDMYGYVDKIMKTQDGKMGLGVHAVRKEKIKEKSADEVLEEICDKGLDIKKGGSMLATVSSLGVSSGLKYYQKEALQSYSLGNEKAEYGVVILVPTILEEIEKKLYVGFPGMDISAVGNNHKKTCILDQLCCGNNEYGTFPTEFILGYFKKENGKRIFKKNVHHFLEMTSKQKESLIENFLNRLTEQQRQISEAVITKDISQLEQLSIKMCGNKDGVLGENTIIQNAMFYLNREIEISQQSVANEKSNRNPKRQILINLYQNISSSDLSAAKELLKEGIGITKEREDYKGKEI